MAALAVVVAGNSARSRPVLPAAGGDTGRSLAGKVPLPFVRNAGQVDSRVRYYGQADGFNAFFTRRGITLDLARGKRGLALELGFVGASPGVRVGPQQRMPGRVSYLGGRRPHAGLATYGQIRYRNVWPGIDMVAGGRGGQLKYEFRVAPGADPAPHRARVSRRAGAVCRRHRRIVDPYAPGHPHRRPAARLSASRRPRVAGRKPLLGRQPCTLRLRDRIVRSQPPARDRPGPRLLDLPRRQRRRLRHRRGGR